MFKKIILQFVFSLSCLVVSATNAATIEFNSTSDDGSLCTLREAITSINNFSLEEGCVLLGGEGFGVNDTVVSNLPNHDNPVVTLAGIELSITKEVTIDASSVGKLTLDASNVSRVLRISNGDLVKKMNVKISNVIIKGGYIESVGGAGIYVSGNTSLSISACAVIENLVSANNARGGGIYAASGELQVDDCQIKGNAIEDNEGFTSANGGGVFLNDTVALFRNSRVSDNQAASGGGGIYIQGEDSKVTIVNSVVYKNTSARFGGGIYKSFGKLDVVNSTISGNSGFIGGGVYIQGGLSVFNNATLSANVSTNNGGGIGFSANSELVVKNSIVAGNKAVSKGTELYQVSESSFTSSNSLLGDSSTSSELAFDGVMPSQSDIEATLDGAFPTSISSVIKPLADNGGLTLTHALSSGSRAIDKGDPNSCSSNDQRGVARDGRCDMGAYEAMQELCLVIPAKNKGIASFCL